MIEALFYGIAWGLGLAFMPGAVFFLLLQTSLSKGRKHAFAVALGIFISDALIASACKLGVADLLSGNSTAMGLTGIIGGIVLVIIGIMKVLQKAEFKGRPKKKVEGKDYVKLFIQGVSMNLLNPPVILFWLSMVTAAQSTYEFNESIAWYFLIGIVGMVFTTDILKIYFSKFLQKQLTHRRIFYLNRIIGFVLAGFGAFLLINSVWSYFLKHYFEQL